MATPAKIPSCYGHLHSRGSADCNCCLLNADCEKAMLRPKIATGTVSESVEVPKDKKKMILAVCHRFGIQPTYYAKREKREYEVTEENLGEFFNLDFLLTTKDALEKLLTAKLA